MNNKGKRIIGLSFAIITPLSLVTGLTGCKHKKEEVINTKVWTAPSGQKINQDYHGYSEDITSQTTLKIEAFRNENESAQILLTPDKDATYDIELNDLKMADGTILPKESFSLFNEKYITVEIAKQPNNTIGSGNYPDALLPWAKAKEYGENKIKAGNNQGIWVNLKANKDQKAGTYTGTFKVCVGNATYDVPVEVTIFNYTLSGYNHSRNAFGSNINGIEAMELDGTPEMHRKYYDFFLDKGICLNTASGPYFGDKSKYYDSVVERTKDPRCSTYQVLWTGGSGQTYFKKDGSIAIGEEEIKAAGTKLEYINSIDFPTTQTCFEKMLERSLTENLDLFDKLFSEFYIYDEFDPEGGAKCNMAIYVIRRYDDFTQHFKEIVDGLTYSNGRVLRSKGYEYNEKNNNAGIGYSFTTDSKSYDTNLTEQEFLALKAKLVKSIDKNKIVATTTRLTEKFAQNLNFSVCPIINYYNSKQTRDYVQSYNDERNCETWTYIAENPANPYPTYHIDDEGISPRMLNWMMSEYNIDGNLYWATDLNKYTKDDVLEAQLESQDYYQNPIRYPTRNGEGYLCYPGRPYGIYGPVSSTRLEAISDGVEDFNLFYELEEIYSERGVSGTDFESIVNLLTRDLYTGARISYSSDYLTKFAKARRLLGKLFELYTNYGAMIEGYNVDSDPVSLTVSAPNDVIVNWNGALATGENQGEYTRYVLPLSFAAGATNVPVFKKNGVEDSIELTFGQAPINISTSSIMSILTAKAGTTSQNSYISDNVDKEGVNTVKVDLHNENETTVNLDFDLSNYDIYKGFSKITLRTYVDSSLELSVSNKGMLSNASTFAAINTQDLEQGWNDITIDIGQMSISETVKCQKVRVTLTMKNGEAFTANTPLYLAKMTVKG